MLKMGLLKMGRIRALATDQRGVAATEFALLAPLMVMMYFGLAELTEGLMASRKTAHVASAIGDLTAQAPSTTPLQLGDIFNVGASLMLPFPTSGGVLKQRVSSVTVDVNNVPRVDWSQAAGGYAALAKGSAVVLPLAPKAHPTDPDTPFIAKGQSLVMAEAHYAFTSPLAQYLTKTSDMKGLVYLMPRSGVAVVCPTC
jgi:Flp pilus assembly protein TadG